MTCHLDVFQPPCITTVILRAIFQQSAAAQLAFVIGLLGLAVCVLFRWRHILCVIYDEDGTSITEPQ